MSDATVKTMIYIIAALLSVYPVIDLLTKSKSKIVKAIIFFGLIFFWFITCKYKGIVDKENTTSKHLNDSLTREVKKRDSIRQITEDSMTTFLKRLKGLGIKDSSNYPVNNKTFNTDIKKARDVYIGND